MMTGLAWMLVANASLLLAAHALLRRVRTEQPAINAVIFILLHLLLVSVVVLAGGFLGFLTPLALGLTGIALLALLLILGEHRHLRLPPRLEIGKPTALLLGFIVLRMLAQVWFSAPFNADVLSYHLTKVAEWVQSGRFTREMGPDHHAPFSAGFELFELWWVVFLHHDVLIELAGLEFAALGFFAVRLLSLHLGLSARAASLAATLYVLTPTFNLQATACLNDAAVASLILSLVAFIVARAHPLLWALPFGLALGIKATGNFSLPGWVLLAFLLRKEPVQRPAAPAAAWPIAAAAGLVGLAWYARNYVWYGHPLYPLYPRDYSYYASLFTIQLKPELASLQTNLADLVSHRIYDEQAGMTPLSFRTAGWGMVAFSLGILALLNEVRKDRRFRIAAAAFLVSLLSVLLMVANDYWFVRFVLFFPAILCIAAARASETMPAMSRLLSVAAILEFAATMFPQEHSSGRMFAMARQPWRERSSATMRRFELREGAVGVWALLRSQTYLLYGPDYSRRVVYLRPSGVAELVPMMEREGLKVAYVRITRRMQFDLEALVSQGRLRDLGNGYYGLP